MGSLLPPRPLPSTARPPILLPVDHHHSRLRFPSSSSPAARRLLLLPLRRCAVSSPTTADATAAAAADLMVALAEAGDVAGAQSIWAQLLLSSAAPSLAAAAPRLLPAYARLGRPDEVLLAARELSARLPSSAARDLYSLSVSSLGAAGELALMESAAREMASRFPGGLDPATGNAFVQHYAAAGTLPQMESAVGRLRRSGALISAAAIRAVASAYISQRKYYRLGEFVSGAGMLRRRDAGNLPWNLYLLSFAANFKMKSLQRAFLEMLAAGFRPDLTTFNVRAAAFSKMCMFWDLHLAAGHMRRDAVAPDLVTHGCFVDAYLERRLARNIPFAFRRLGTGAGADEPAVATDGIVFEAFGKGGFHASSEAVMESATGAGGKRRRWTYYSLLDVYLKKQHRKNQIFWNY